jgi:hypothetical protein
MRVCVASVLRFCSAPRPDFWAWPRQFAAQNTIFAGITAVRGQVIGASNRGIQVAIAPSLKSRSKARRINRPVALALASGFAVAAAPNLAWAVNYQFDFMDTTTTQAGLLTITAPSIGQAASAVTGTFGSITITGLSPYGGADNILTVTSPYA